MTTRGVIGSVLFLDGSATEGDTVRFRSERVGFGSDAIYMPSDVVTTVQANGDIERKELWASAEGGRNILCIMANGYAWRFRLEAGGDDITLQELHALHAPLEPAVSPTIQTLIETATAAAVEFETAALVAADTAESAARSSADTALQANVTAEATARANADTTLTTNLTAEAASRVSGDAAVTSAFQAADTAEATTRAAADTTLTTNLAAELVARANGDAGLQALLDALAAALPHSGTLTPAQAMLYASGPRYHVAAYGAIASLSDATTKALNRSAIGLAIAAAKAAGGGEVFFDNAYYVDKYIHVYQADGVTFRATGRGKILYPSDDATVLVDATATSIARARSAFYVSDSDNVTFEGVTFEGSSTSTDIGVNVGCGVYATSSTNLRLIRCTNNYGASLLNQDAMTDDVGTRIIGCAIYGARGNLTVGYDAVITSSHFELPTTSSYDRVDTTHGSSHAIYIFAGRQNVIIFGNHFKNIRTNGVKVSGSSLPIRLVTVTENIFDDCGGGVEYGADDLQEHSGLICNENHYINCGTNKTGWTEGYGVHVLGARSVQICNNHFYYTRDSIASVSAVKGIFVSRYLSTSQPIEQVEIKDNQFHGLLTTAWTASTAYALNFLARPVVKNGLHYACTTAGTSGASEPTWPTTPGGSVTDGTVVWRCRGAGDASAPGSIVTNVIQVADVGAGAATYGSAQVTGNQITSVGTVGLFAQRNVGLVIDENVFNNVPTAVSLQGNRFPVFGPKNILIPGASTSTNAQIRMVNESFPIIHVAPTAGRLINGAGKTWTIADNNGGSSAVVFPLLGVRGKATPSAGRPEIVFAYGDGWTTGDTVNMNGTTFTYRATSPGASEFNTIAGLIALIDAMANIGAADYGAQFSPAVTTNHIRVRYDTALNTASAFFVRVTAVNPTAGVVLSNGTGVNLLHCFARGEGTAPGAKTVIWSPLATQGARLWAANSAARTLLQANEYYIEDNADIDTGSCAIANHATTSGSEEFRWSASA